MHDHFFHHENLDAYRVALSVARWAAGVTVPRGVAHLGDQLRRACSSVVLNIAESCRPNGSASRNHLRIALGSAAEACAVLDLVDLPDGAAQQQKLRRVGAMLHGLGAR